MSLTASPHNPPPGAVLHQLAVKPIFAALKPRDKFYAHYMARAAWHGSRIVMRQVSPENPDIFDFIIDLYHACGGD
jgi:dipeptidyl-peptidase-3